jgi:hypothetical protein
MSELAARISEGSPGKSARVISFGPGFDVDFGSAALGFLELKTERGGLTVNHVEVEALAADRSLVSPSAGDFDLAR